MQERCLDADNTLLLWLFQSQIERLPRRIPLANRRLVDPLLCDLGLQEPPIQIGPRHPPRCPAREPSVISYPLGRSGGRARLLDFAVLCHRIGFRSRTFTDEFQHVLTPRVLPVPDIADLPWQSARRIEEIREPVVIGI